MKCAVLLGLKIQKKKLTIERRPETANLVSDVMIVVMSSGCKYGYTQKLRR
jgi:hypothetical protein